MNAYLPFEATRLWHIAGWTMIHFLWLGAIVAAAAFALRLVLLRTSPNVRYGTALACLAVLAALPLGIAGWIMNNFPASPLAALPAIELVADGDITVTQPIEPEAISANATPEVVELHAPSLTAESPLPPREGSGGGSSSDLTTLNAAEPSPSPSLTERGITVAAALEVFASYLPWLWLIGTPITFILLAAGLVGTKRLRRASRPLTNGPLVEALHRLASSLRISQQVTLAVCDRIAAPVLIGILRPMILLPPAALTGWTPDEIEMVLLHELAHVRRWDNLVNLLQRGLESLLFFHPAVWLVSAWVRREREACCDAAVVARTNRPHAYAELLVALAAQMPRSVLFHPAASSAMSTGPLRGRIRRILGLQEDPMLISGKSFTLMLAALIVGATLIAFSLPNGSKPAAQARDEVTESQPKNARQRRNRSLIVPAEPTTENPESTEKKDGDSSDSSNADDAKFPHVVKFEKGAERFLDSDNITITEVRGTSETFAPGNRYLITGTYTLASRDAANLSAFTTASKAKDATSPIASEQTTRIKRGEHKFTLVLPMNHGGWPHVSFYPAGGGNGFGGVYFGTGETVLNKWPGGKENDAKTSTASGNDVVEEFPTTNLTDEQRSSLVQSAFAAISRGESVDLVQRDNNTSLIRRDLTEAAWPAILGEPPRKERVIAEKAWQRLGLKLVPLSKFEQQHKSMAADLIPGGMWIVGGNVPKGLPVPCLLKQVDGNVISNINELLIWLDSEWGRNRDARRCIAVADGNEYLLECSPPPAKQANGPKDNAGAGRDWYGNPIGPDSKFDWNGNRINVTAQPDAVSADSTAPRQDAMVPNTPAPPANPLAGSQSTTPARASASPEELEILREHVEVMKQHFERVDALYKTASRGGSADRRESAARELALAEVELALAEGKADKASEKLNDARNHAEQAYKAVTAMYESGNATHDAVLQAARNLMEIKREIIRLQAPRAESTGTNQPTVPTAPPPVLAPAAVPQPTDRYVAPPVVSSPAAKSTPRPAPSAIIISRPDDSPIVISSDAGNDASTTASTSASPPTDRYAAPPATPPAANHAEPVTGENQPSPLKPADADRIVVSYDIPTELIDSLQGYALAKHMPLNRLEKRFMMQATREQHEQFKTLLDETSKWRDEAAKRKRGDRPVYYSLDRNKDGEMRLKLFAAGLTFAESPKYDKTHAGPPARVQRGVAIVEVAPGSPAAWQDIRPGDELTTVGDFATANLAELESVFNSLIGTALVAEATIRRPSGRGTYHQKHLILRERASEPDNNKQSGTQVPGGMPRSKPQPAPEKQPPTQPATPAPGDDRYQPPSPSPGADSSTIKPRPPVAQPASTTPPPSAPVTSPSAPAVPTTAVPAMTTEPQPGAPNLQSKSSLSEPQEVVLSMDGMKFMLDLDTGQTMDPPATRGRPEQARMDVHTTQVQPYHYPTGLIGLELQGMQVKASDWEAPPSDVRRALASDRMQPLKQMDIGPEANPTYFFKTRDGTEGVLQLLGLVHEPKGIRIRYKRVASTVDRE